MLTIMLCYYVKCGVIEDKGTVRVVYGMIADAFSIFDYGGRIGLVALVR